MSIFRRIEITIGVLLLLAVVTLGVISYGQHKVISSTKSENKVLTGDAKAHEVYATGTKVLVTKEKHTNEQMDAAIKANPEWADAPVPSDVAAVLCHNPKSACNLP